MREYFIDYIKDTWWVWIISIAVMSGIYALQSFLIGSPNWIIWGLLCGSIWAFIMLPIVFLISGRK